MRKETGSIHTTHDIAFLPKNLFEYTTEELAQELKSRDEVVESYAVEDGEFEDFTAEGPCEVLVILKTK